jgi:hypothetical protein
MYYVRGSQNVLNLVFFAKILRSVAVVEMKNILMQIDAKCSRYEEHMLWIHKIWKTTYRDPMILNPGYGAQRQIRKKKKNSTSSN